MKITGKIDLFKNSRGYVTGQIKAFDSEKHLLGKCFVDVVGVTVAEGETLTIDIKEGYLNCIHVTSEGKESFDKLVISVKEYDVVSSYKKRPSGKESK